MDDAAAPRYASLGDYARLLRAQWPLILLPAVLAVAAALAYSLHQTPSYQAEAQVMIQDETQQLSLLGTPVATSTSVSPGAVVAQTIDTLGLARAVRRSLRTRIPPAALMGDVSLSVDATTGLLDVTAATTTARLSAALANAYARQIAGRTTRSVDRQFATAATALQRRLRQLSPSGSGDAGERATLLDEISRLQFLQATSTPGQVARAAVVPGAPSSPNPARDAGLGLAVGLLIGLIAAFVRDALDGRLRGSSEISGELGLRLLGQVRGTALGQAVDPAVAERNGTRVDVEAFRILRDNVELLTAGRAAGVVLVTSSLPEEGKSTVAASLARASAAAGRRTVLIEADLRRPALAERLKIRPAPGLTEYLVGKVEAADVVRPVPLVAGASSNGNHGAESNGRPPATQLACIPAGYPHTGAAELLTSSRMRDLLTELAATYDLVIVDSAPLLPVADTRALLTLVDAVVLCVRSGRTTQEQLRAVGAALTRVPADAAGVVVTDVRAADAAAGHSVYATYYGDAERATD